MMPRPSAAVLTLLALLLTGATTRAADLPGAGGEDPADTGDAPATVVLERKTLARWPDPIVANCGIFTSLQGKRIADIRVYAHQEGDFAPIPFQVDEKDAAGSYIYLAGEHPNPGEANGLMDEGEELVFMARDSGDRVSPAAFPAGVEAWEEMELVDPVDGKKGWVYLLYAGATDLPASAGDYILYEPVFETPTEGPCQIIKSRYMEDRYYPMEPYFDVSSMENVGFAHRYMSTPPEAGGTNVDYVDRLKGRLVMAFLFGVLKFRVNENKVTFYEAAYKDGPIRLVRNIQIIIHLPLGMKAPGIAVDLLWYDTIVNVPMIINLPFNPGKVYTYMELRLSEDHAPPSIGMRVYNSNNPQGVVVDGRTSPEEAHTWDNGRDAWRLITGPQGTVMNRSFWDERYLEQMKWVRVDYIDDLEEDDPPEEDSGMLGMIAQTNRVEGVKKDRYYSYLEWYWPPSFLFSGPGRTYRLGDEQSYLNIADHPVRIVVGDNRMSNSYFGSMPSFDRADQLMEKKRDETAPVDAE